MEGPVLTESEVWKVGSGANTSLNTIDRNIDFSPLMNDNVPDENVTNTSENSVSAVKEGMCITEEQPDPEVTPDQMIPHDLQLEEDLSSTQTEVKSDEASEALCKEERCVNQAEEPADKTCLAPDQQDHNKEVNQEITILVTSHDCTLEDDENEDCEEQKTYTCPTESKTIPSIASGEPIEEESQDGSIVVANMIEVSQVLKTSVISNVSTEEEPKSPKAQAQEENRETTNSAKAQHNSKQNTDADAAQKIDANSTLVNTNTKPRISVEVEVRGLKDQPTQSEGKEVNTNVMKTEPTDSKNAGQLPQETLSLTRSPGRQQHVQTQVSLEVMYHSVATSPMTPPEGSATFLFPSTFGKLANKCSTEVPQTIETKDAELQVGLQAEFRSVATAPMTPIVLTAPEVIPEPEPRIGVAPEETPEPVQEVSWDEKGMTWEVYGAVVEVTVLGTAIQKHLEKQVKKHKNQPPTLPALTEASQKDPPTEAPIIIPSSPPPTSDSNKCSPAKEPSTKNEEEKVQRGRRNPFRRWFRNFRRPSCCSRPRQDEGN